MDNVFNLENLKNYGALLTTTDAIICNYMSNYDDISSKKYLDYLKYEQSDKITF